MKKSILPLISILLLLLFLSPPYASCDSSYLREGINQYKLENYEESAEILIKARHENPKSSVAAFFLGLAYKQMIDYPSAVKNLRDAVTLTPPIKEALVELVDVLYHLPGKENLEEAGKWISVAEDEKIFPAKIAFLKGLGLRKNGKNKEAIESFERAEALDKSLAQSSKFQIGLCYLAERELHKAQESFGAVVLRDPQSDLASYARQYQDTVLGRIERERPLRLTLGLFGQYNNNLTNTPTNNDLAKALGTDYIRTRALSTTLKIDYLRLFKGPWLFSAQYAFSGNFNDKKSTSRDNIINSISLTPGYNFGRHSLNLATSFSHTLLRNPDYDAYSNYLSVGPLYRMLLGSSHILEFFAGYDRTNYFQDPLSPEGDRDSDGPRAYMSWIWLFETDAFYNLRYEFIDEDAKGRWWENQGHKVSINTAYPLTDKLDLQLSAEAYFQDYDHDSPNLTVANNIMTANEKKREDSTYRFSAGFTWELSKNLTFVAQYTRTRVNSTIGLYDYTQNLYTSGLEFRY